MLIVNMQIYQRVVHVLLLSCHRHQQELRWYWRGGGNIDDHLCPGDRRHDPTNSP